MRNLGLALRRVRESRRDAYPSMIPKCICPPNRSRYRAALHRVAGFPHWQPDVLRHTFATHHLAAFRSYEELQLEMGHRSTTLLRTRYIAMETQCGMLVA